MTDWLFESLRALSLLQHEQLLALRNGRPSTVRCSTSYVILKPAVSVGVVFSFVLFFFFPPRAPCISGTDPDREDLRLRKRVVARKLPLLPSLLSCYTKVSGPLRRPLSLLLIELRVGPMTYRPLVVSGPVSWEVWAGFPVSVHWDESL